jgi:hypothetical protein
VKSIVLLVVGWTLLLQAAGTSPQLSPRELLDARRRLTDTEIASVLSASRDALTGKTFRLYAGGTVSGPEVLMRGDGQMARFRASYGTVGGVVSTTGQHSRWSEDITKIVDYTNRPARQCDATAGSGSSTSELVIEYTRSRRTPSPSPQPPAWSVAARRRIEREAGGPGFIPAFEMLHGIGGAGSSLASDDHQPQRIGDRQARGFVARFVSLHAGRRDSPSSTPRIGDPEPNVAGEPPPRPEPNPMQTLWIDTESLLPLRWDVTDHGRREQRFDFIFEPLDIRLPTDLGDTAVPDCIR